MSRHKEDVLLMIKHVRYKKVDGTLYVNSGRVAWRNQTSDTFRISAPFEDIRVQRISPDQKEKVQLQLLMHNGESFTFHFSDPAGRQRQLEMRNSVKEMLQSLLPKFKDKAHSELREKFRLLESNPEVLSLYRELVVTGILTSDEFWARPEFSNTAVNALNPISAGPNAPPSSTQASAHSSTHSASQSTGQISRGFRLGDRPQVVGVPNYLLSDIKPEADGTNGIKYSLTHETIDAIFRAYPMVRQRHRELVPDKLTETEFWVKFFQSHYFHRDRVQLPKGDVFADCASLDERYLQNELRRSRRNRISAHLNLDGLTDHDIGVGYGVDRDAALVTDKSSGAIQSANLSANQLLLRRFNNHSLLVLKSLGSSDIASGLAPTSHPAENSSQSQPSEASTLATSVPVKDRIFTSELVEEPKPTHIPLDLVNVRDYLEGPVTKERTAPTRPTIQSGRQSDSTLPNERLELALNSCKASMRTAYMSGRKRRTPVLTALAAQMALADVSPGGCLVGGSKTSESTKSARVDRLSNASTTDGNPVESFRSSVLSGTSRVSSSTNDDMNQGPALLTGEQLRELSLLYASACELLRHFWACFPVTNQQLTEKLERISASLVRFRATKVAHFVASLDQAPMGGKLEVVSSSASTSTNNNRTTAGSLPYRSRVTGHLECMLDAAQRKFAEWKALQRR